MLKGATVIVLVLYATQNNSHAAASEVQLTCGNTANDEDEGTLQHECPCEILKDRMKYIKEFTKRCNRKILQCLSRNSKGGKGRRDFIVTKYLICLGKAQVTRRAAALAMAEGDCSKAWKKLYKTISTTRKCDKIYKGLDPELQKACDGDSNIKECRKKVCQLRTDLRAKIEECDMNAEGEERRYEGPREENHIL